jgi:biotin carboxylase
VVAGDPQRRAQRLLVLGAGPAQLGLLEAARARGLYVIALDRNPSAPGFALAERRAIVSTEDEVAVERLAAAEGIAGVISPGADWPVAVAARVAARLGLPHALSPETAQVAVSKLKQRERFAAAGVPQPRHAVCRTVEEAVEAAVAIGLPCVLKPPDRQGQRGVAVAATAAEAAQGAEAALELSRGGLVLVEELVEGPEVTVNAFSSNGRFEALAVADRVLADPPAFGVALAHVFPSEHDVAGAVAAAAAAAAALGIENGPSYTQVLLSPRGALVGELAARLGGGHDAELVRAVTGVDLNELALGAALGESSERPPAEPAAPAACIRFLVPPPGELIAVHGVEDAAQAPGVQWVRIYRRPGHVFGEFRAGPDRAGAVLALGATRAEAVRRAEAAAESVRFSTADVEAALNP